MTIFGRKEGVVDTLRRENERARRRLQQILAERARIRDMASRIAAGVPVSAAGAAGSLEGMLDRLRIQTAYREQLALRTKIAQAEAEMQAESVRLEQEIERIEQKLQEPLSLTISTPFGGQQVTIGTALTVQWSATGPVGDRVRIGLLKNGIFLRTISLGTPTDAGSFYWSQVPRNLPLAKDYQVSVQDPTSGLCTLSDPFEIK